MRLPGTAEEAAAIAPKLNAVAANEARLLLGADATEDAFKALYRPQLLVLSTHGFFRPANAVTKPRHPGTARKPTAPHQPQQPTRNPLLRCGILLAGANKRQQCQDTQEDGILTGLEIILTDLQGTKLVVLSACETGVGDVQIGEGVAGLRQAFQLAGAEAVIATLWQIPDRESVRMMVTFFEQWSQGRCKAEALAIAQRNEISRRRDRYGAAHPFYWAAFTVTGSLGAGWESWDAGPEQGVQP
jgi:CHAT domain-containing protein